MQNIGQTANVYFGVEVETRRSQLRFGVASIETNQWPLGAVLELHNETWMHIMLSEHPVERQRPNGANIVKPLKNY